MRIDQLKEEYNKGMRELRQLARVPTNVRDHGLAVGMSMRLAAMKEKINVIENMGYT